MFIKKNLPYFVLICILVITYFIYYPGLRGGFLFDDFHNLEEMTRYGDMNVLNNALSFILGGGAGPTGRPISLASFLLQANSWPNDATPFKAFNLYLHLICGFLLFWVTKLLLESYGYIEKRALWVAVISSGIWLLHPMFVSTTLYVIQRMAQLPMLFGLLGILGYLKGRYYIQIQPIKGYVMMTSSIGIATLLATYSKENGALLPLLVLIIEFCNPLKEKKPALCWRIICLWLPSLALFLLLATYIDFSDDPWKNRPFNQIERLLSESRILCDYLFQLFFIRIEGDGLFQDGYNISKSLFEPITTFFSIIFLVFSFVLAIVFKQKYPIVSLAILFFFASHLIESSVIGLELYFEHRNYMAAMFLFLPVSVGLYDLFERVNIKLATIITLLLFSYLALFTWQRSNLWSDTQRLQIFWAQKNTNSPRAQVFLSQQLMKIDHNDEANKLLEKAIHIRPDSSLLSIRLIRQKIDSAQINLKDFIYLKNSLCVQRIDGQSITDLRLLVRQIQNDKKLSQLFALYFIDMLNEIYKVNVSFKSIDSTGSLKYFLQGQLYLGLEEPEKAYQAFYQSLYAYDDTEAGLGMVIELANAGYLQEALNLLNHVEKVDEKQSGEKRDRTNEYYSKNIQEIRTSISRDLEIVLKQQE